MSDSTALMWVLGIGMLALALALLVVWRKLQTLSQTVSTLSAQSSPPRLSSEPFPSMQSGRSRSSTNDWLPSDSPGLQPAQDVLPRVQHATSFPLITQPRDGEVTAARVASVTLAEPLIKAAAFTAGLRRALDEERRMRILATFRRELRRQRRLRRRQRAGRASSDRLRP